jgi:UDP-N-acetylmuramoyl-tripeptide--D-alanyl-D-alanine ligase
VVEYPASQFASVASGTLVAGNPDGRFHGVSIDSRTLRADELFFCIRGDRFDGHDFIADVWQRNPAGIVLSDIKKLPAGLQPGPFIVLVKDTLRALQDLARFHRNRIPARVVAVTGTNGKSTTKEMTAALAQTRFSTLKNKGNLNNHIGLPLTLLQLEPGHQVAVVEMGMSAKGEIRRLAEIASPQIGIITNISEAHMVHLKTLKDVQEAKGELFQALGESHTAIINADDPLVLELARSLKAKPITFGIRNEADFRAVHIRQADLEGYQITVQSLAREFSLHLPLPGAFNIYNALAAMAAGHALGLDADDMVRGFSGFKSLGQRLEILRHNSMTLINDTYNANPQSMHAAMQMLGQYKTDGRKFFVMGDMLELGELSPAAHSRMGVEAAHEPIDFLLTVGELAGLAVRSAHDAGMKPDRAIALQSHQEIVDFLKRHAVAGDCLLFKGSRGSKMEKIIEGLMAPGGR